MIKEAAFITVMLSKLALPPSTVGEFERKEVTCLAHNIYHEARGESTKGKIFLAFSTLNRVAHDNYPDTVCKVVHQKRCDLGEKGVHRGCTAQYSWVIDPKVSRVTLLNDDGVIIPKNVENWRASVEVAVLAYFGKIKNPTNGATHFYNPAKANPEWARRREFRHVATVDNHKYFKQVAYKR
jgi:N-acetylmuramoyl-L-alanine amidase